MNPTPHAPSTPGVFRRDFVAAASATIACAALASCASTAPKAAALLTPHVSGRRLRIGVIGCGGRGTGAAMDALNASPDTQIWAMGDCFKDRLDGSRAELAKLESPMAERARPADDRCFVGFDAYRKVLASGVDIVILATPPGFRPIHFAAAVEAGKHVFFEKPVAVDATGIRMVLDAARKAREKNLTVVTGTQRRHERCYLEAVERVRDGAIGKVASASVYWNQGGLWMHKRRPEWTDTEWQLRNWLYFAWLSGDHIVEQHVHNLDVAHWFMDALPARVGALGGRQVRTSPDYGHAFDHFACDFEYADGRRVSSQCRQIDGCSGRVEEVIHGTEGYAVLRSGFAQIHGKKAWRWQGKPTNPYELEHRDLVASVTGAGPYLNEAERIAHSTMMAIMGRMSAYTGKNVSWDQAMNSKLNLMPTTVELGSMPAPEVAVPGKTLLV
jgi:predicted dehydrogenase